MIRMLLPAAVALAAVACSSSSGGSADPGSAAFRPCAMCHRIEAAAGNAVGPNLHGVFGRKAGSAPGFNYSPAMGKSGLVWDAATLDRFLTSPQKTVPGTRMSFGGMADPAQRRQVIAYLQAQSPGGH